MSETTIGQRFAAAFMDLAARHYLRGVIQLCERRMTTDYIKGDYEALGRELDRWIEQQKVSRETLPHQP